MVGFFAQFGGGGVVEFGDRSTTGFVVTPPGQNGTMSRQLVLIDPDEPDWRLDDHTIEVGLRGIAAAREVLRRHREAAGGNKPYTDHPHAA